jgi:hypothetical protein
LIITIAQQGTNPNEANLEMVSLLRFCTALSDLPPENNESIHNISQQRIEVLIVVKRFRIQVTQTIDTPLSANVHKTVCIHIQIHIDVTASG